jgi:uncharacterized protein (TIGR00251 family)
MNWIEARPDGVLIRLYIQPRASKTEVIGLHGEPARLKIRVASPPVEGAANEECIEFLSRQLKQPKSSITLIAGFKSRTKDFLCAGTSLENAKKILLFNREFS